MNLQGPVRVASPVPEQTSSRGSIRSEHPVIPLETTRFEELDINRVLAEALTNLAPLVEERGAEIRSGTMPVIHGDRNLIRQLLQNLIANGTRLCRDRPPKIDIRARRESGRWHVTVTDNSNGIEPRHYPSILRMLEGLPVTEEVPGVDTGLTVCQSIMKHHGGRLDIESVTGQGNTFTLAFN